MFVFRGVILILINTIIVNPEKGSHAGPHSNEVKTCCRWFVTNTLRGARFFEDFNMACYVWDKSPGNGDERKVSG